MLLEENQQQKIFREGVREFVVSEILPKAETFDKEETISRKFISKLSSKGYLGALLPEQYGGLGLDMLTYGLLNEELGRGCASVRALVMLQNMVAQAIHRWGNESNKEKWLERIAKGGIIAAFSLTEPDIGSDALKINTTATREGDGYCINGTKTWVSFGQVANVFLVFAKCQGKHAAFLVEKDVPGLEIEPIQGMLGMRASMLARLYFRNVHIPEAALLGGVGFGFLPIGAMALNLGRYSIAWGCVGMAQECLEKSIHHTKSRKQFGVHLKDHQLIQKMIADMIVNVKAARYLCHAAALSGEKSHPDHMMDTMVAKYHATKTATQASNDAVQIHGALGCHRAHGVERYLRDAKIMEIIEGTTQIHQIKIAESGYKQYSQV